MNRRPRRNRRTAAIRGMVRETRVHLDQLIYPFFLIQGEGQIVPVTSMPGINRYSVDEMLKEMGVCMELGLRNFILFPAFPDPWSSRSCRHHHQGFVVLISADPRSGC